MILYQDTQTIKQLPKNRGAYYYVQLDAQTVDTFPLKNKTRLICSLKDQVEFQCGLNHLGDGNFFIILSKSRLEEISMYPGEDLSFTVKQDPNPLGVDMPEVLEVLLEQDAVLKGHFEKLTMGKKRHIIHSINRIKSIDIQINKATTMIMSYVK